ncbi:hypothetical protein L4X63_21625 [Geomonas sp. Red32]|uniref:hypothetical protein n=1 Tax=Geomonas sp. Red32 TaxID=2912856 RepID=UPI00202CA9C1|nr:hypothetical protein [Geomonas sp. Red32]MCM0084187.1 hypothetical protein [Geomonas sp. Red32]
MRSSLKDNNAVQPLSLEMKVVLDRCERIETTCAEIYRVFAHMHAEYPKLQALWFSTAEDEVQHASQFNLLSRMKGGSIAGITVEVGDADSVLGDLELLLARVRNEFVPPDLALQIAVRVENHLTSFHSTSVVLCKDEALQRLLQAMMSNDDRHIERLEQALKEFQAARDAFNTVLRKVEGLFEEIGEVSLSRVQTLKVAIKFESLLARYRRGVLQSGNDPGLEPVLRRLIENNEGEVGMIEEALEELLAAQPQA